ncbi:hypothetical protein ACFLRH_02145 [Actinomycetota bacterium]
MWRKALVLMMTGAAMMLPACSDEAAEANDPPAADVVLRVVANGDVAADWTLLSLEDAVEFAELTVDGDKQSGPLLLDVLEASGVPEWNSAEVLGMGEGRVFEVALEISSAEVDDGWILDVTNQGSLKLAAANLPREQWVRDVGEIRIP